MNGTSATGVGGPVQSGISDAAGALKGCASVLKTSSPERARHPILAHHPKKKLTIIKTGSRRLIESEVTDKIVEFWPNT